MPTRQGGSDEKNLTTSARSQPSTKDDSALLIDTVDLEHVLGEVETNRDNLHGGRRSSLWRLATTTLWHCNAGSGRRPPHQSRHLVEWVEGEPSWFFRPALADELVGREALQRLQAPAEVVGCNEVGEVLSELVVARVTEALDGGVLDGLRLA